MKGYKKVHHVWFHRTEGWYPVGVGMRPVDIQEIDNARDVAFEAMSRQGVGAVMVVKVEESLMSDLRTGKETKNIQYSVLL